MRGCSDDRCFSIKDLAIEVCQSEFDCKQNSFIGIRLMESNGFKHQSDWNFGGETDHTVVIAIDQFRQVSNWLGVRLI